MPTYLLSSIAKVSQCFFRLFFVISDAALRPGCVRLSRSLCKCATAFGCRELEASGCSGRASLETLGLVYEHEFVILLRAQTAGFGNLCTLQSRVPLLTARLAWPTTPTPRASVQCSKPGSRERSGTAIKMFLGCSRSRSASVADQLDRPLAPLGLVSLTELSPMLVPCESLVVV